MPICGEIMTSKQYSHSATYAYIDEALRSRWEGFCLLEKEMASFKPKPIEQYHSARDEEVERLQILNPTASVESLLEHVNRNIEYIASEKWQFHECFDQRLMTEYVTVVMLSHSLCEALINAIIAIGLAEKGATDLFTLIENAEFKRKWLIGPKSFYPEYEFPVGTGIHQTLSLLVKDRNALMHSKIELTVNGQKVMEGSREPLNKPQHLA